MVTSTSRSYGAVHGLDEGIHTLTSPPEETTGRKTAEEKGGHQVEEVGPRTGERQGKQGRGPATALGQAGDPRELR